VLSPILTHLFNSCINEGSYPDCFKNAQITPVCKSADQTNCNNYRPISILLQLNKILEKILHTRVYAYLQEFNLLSNCQYGFRPKSATAFAVENIYFNLLINKQKGSYTCSIFLDLSKAFDTVNHDISLQKLQLYFRIRGVPLQLFSNYLLNRKQYVINRNTKSSLKNISCGVPQGSVLGPLLFIMYTSDLPNCSTFTTVLYADDTYLCLSDKNLYDLQLAVNSELLKVDRWMRLNKLSIINSKSSYMLTSKSLRNTDNKNIPSSFQICINDVILSQKNVSNT